MKSLKNLWQLRYSILTNNIVVLLMVFGITPLAVLFIVFQNVYISQEKEGVERLQRENVLRLSDQISSYISLGLIQVDGLIERMGGDFAEQKALRRLQEFLLYHPIFDRITFLDDQGREVCKAARDYTYQALELEDRRTAPEIQKALAGNFSVSLAKPSPNCLLPCINLLLPMKSKETGIKGGVIEAGLNPIPLWAILAKHTRPRDDSAYIVSQDGQLIAGLDFGAKLISQDLTALPIVRVFVAGQTGVYKYQSLDGQQVIGASASIPAAGWGVIVEKKSSTAFGRIHQIATFFLGLFAVTLIAAVIRGLIFSQEKIIWPVKALQQEIETLSQGIMPQGLDVKGSDEMGKLSQAFNEMVQHLKDTMVSQDLLVQEMAERKLIEETLRSREETLRSIFLAVPLGIGSIHKEILVDANEFFFKMTGYSKEETRGKNLNFLFNQKRDYKKMVGQLHQIHGNEETVAMETQWRRRDGQVRDIYLNFSLIDKTDPGKNLIFAAMDISDLKKMEKERLRMDNLESLGIMAGGIAHDFNNILTIIMGNIELVGLEIKHPDKSLARLLEAEQACQRARHLAKQLLTFAKGGMPIKKPRLAGELLQNVVPLALSGSNSAVEISIDDNTWPIDIDEAQIQQVINNILINADQAMPDGGLITITVTNQALTPAHGIPLPSGNYVKISVIDQGIGISEKDLGKIFDPYFTTKQLGNGLGLTAAFSIIKNHQGYISVDSKLGQGSRFHIYLPAATTAPLICDTKVSEIPIRGYGRILVMDDEPAILVVLSQMLNKLGYEAVCVENGQQVLETYQRAQKSNRFFDAAILDLTIPGGLGGKETIGILRKLDPHVQVIVSSGYANDPIMADYEKFGFNGVIAKPYKILELSLILHNLLTSKKSLGQQIQNEDTTNLQNDTR